MEVREGLEQDIFELQQTAHLILKLLQTEEWLHVNTTGTVTVLHVLYLGQHSHAKLFYTKLSSIQNHPSAIS